jgi:nicotinate-nucleotide pyrophosphorylase (carboxylating)
MDWNSSYIRGLISTALAENVGDGDLAVAATIRERARAQARLVANQNLICAGLPLAEKVFQGLDPQMSIELRARDGQEVTEGGDILQLRGAARAILTGERTALNFLGRLCGIATQTRRFVQQLAGTPVRIQGTHKTMPGLRRLEQYAVELGGGGANHPGFGEAILLTANHVALAGGVKAALDQAHTYASSRMNPRFMTAYEAGGGSRSEEEETSLSIQIEVRNEVELREALSAGAEFLLLVNLLPEQAGHLIRIARTMRADCRVEILSEIALFDVRAYAETGADCLSSGALTLSAPQAAVTLLVDNLQ